MRAAVKMKETAASLAALQELMQDDLNLVNQRLLQELQSEVTLIPELARHLIAAGGKRLRPLLTLASAKLCGHSGSAHIVLATAVEFIHTATLLHDDVVDHSSRRRGLDTANAIWGNKASVLVGDFLFSRAFALMVEAGSLAALDALSKAAVTIATGEVHQLLTANNITATEKDYAQVIHEKTAALFAAACKVGGIIAGRDEKTSSALEAYGLNLGLAFQLSDDVLDYTGIAGKNPGDDFRDGKMTLPVILAYAKGSAEEKEFWKRCMVDGRQEEGDFARARELVMRHNALEEVLRQAQSHAAQALKALSIFPPSVLRTAMEDAARFAVERAEN